jgi:hypothetical protein
MMGICRWTILTNTTTLLLREALSVEETVADAKGVVGAGEDEGAVGQRLGAASMNKKKKQ